MQSLFVNEFDYMQFVFIKIEHIDFFFTGEDTNNTPEYNTAHVNSECVICLYTMLILRLRN